MGAAKAATSTPSTSARHLETLPWNDTPGYAARISRFHVGYDSTIIMLAAAMPSLTARLNFSPPFIPHVVPLCLGSLYWLALGGLPPQGRLAEVFSDSFFLGRPRPRGSSDSSSSLSFSQSISLALCLIPVAVLVTVPPLCVFSSSPSVTPARLRPSSPVSGTLTLASPKGGS